MSDVNISQSNWISGELSPNMRGRYNLPVYAAGAERFVNFVPEMQGPARFRNGTQFVVPTRRNQVAWYIAFQFNDSQSYLLEFTHKYIRILRNNGILVEGSKAIAGITGDVINVVSHGYVSGDEIFIFDTIGTEFLNGKNYLVVYVDANHFSLTDTDGNPISIFSSWASGGVTERIVEIKTPYYEEDLEDLKNTQNADTMYITHKFYEQRKFTRFSAVSWTLTTFSRTSDPFTAKKVITAITQAAQGVITSTGHGYSTGDPIIIEGIVGMTELNGTYGFVSDAASNTFKIKDRTGTYINTTGFGAYVSGGYASSQRLLPAVCWFYESRLLYGCTENQLETFWGSRIPTTAGIQRYDDFTTGTDPDNAFVFSIAPSSGKVEKIQWFAGTTRYFAIGTFGGVSKVNGGTDDTALSPTNINVRPAVINGGGASSVSPIALGNALLYLQRTNRILFNLEYDLLYDAFVPTDKNLTADHITASGIKQMIYQNARPESVFLLRNDGILLQVVYKTKENINGWARVLLGGPNAKVITIGQMPRDNAFDQVWACVERKINGVTRRYNEYFSDAVIFPESVDFFTGKENKALDLKNYQDAMYGAQQDSIHMDSVVTIQSGINITNIELIGP